MFPCRCIFVNYVEHPLPLSHDYSSPGHRATDSVYGLGCLDDIELVVVHLPRTHSELIQAFCDRVVSDVTLNR